MVSFYFSYWPFILNILCLNRYFIPDGTPVTGKISWCAVQLWKANSRDRLEFYVWKQLLLDSTLLLMQVMSSSPSTHTHSLTRTHTHYVHCNECDWCSWLGRDGLSILQETVDSLPDFHLSVRASPPVYRRVWADPVEVWNIWIAQDG